MAEFEERKEDCWKCKFFIQAAEDFPPRGVCVRHAPTKLDQKFGIISGSVIPGLEMFQSILYPETAFCGQWARFEGVLPPLPQSPIV